MPTTPIGTIHFIFALAALVAGAYVCLNPKGNARHRRRGWLYFLSMVGVNVTAFMLYNLLGHFGPFHVAAVISLLTVMAGIVVAHWRLPRKNWIEGHAMWMAWSYVGLCAAAVAEVSTRFFPQVFWGTVVAATLTVVALGSWTIKRTVPGIVKSFGRA